MELTYHFRKLVRAQVLLGIVAFCIAEQNPMMLVIAGSLAMLSWYIVEGPTGKPLPRFVINLGALTAVAWLLLDIFSLHRGQVIVAMGHFTIWLQILELYANKTNRDYGLILVLSLTQMVGASILSVSIIYGILLIIYCILALLTILIFHFKSVSDFVTDANKKAATRPEEVANPRPVVGRGFRWQFRFTAAAIGGMCAAVAIVIFLLLPRKTPAGTGGGISGANARPTVGFSNQVRLGTRAPRSGSREPMMHVAIRQHDESIGNGAMTFLVRGLALDRYDRMRHTWERSSSAAGQDSPLEVPEDGVIEFADVSKHAFEPFDVQFTLRVASGSILFTLDPVTRFQSSAVDKLLFNPIDQKLSAHGATPGALVYHIQSPYINPPNNLFEQYKKFESDRINSMKPMMDLDRKVLPERDDQTYARYWPVETRRIRNLTMDIIDSKDPSLVRDPMLISTPNDMRIAGIIRDYLNSNYDYDLNNPPIERGKDPIVEFLFTQRQGHCELFAAGMAAMCRSIGIPARVVNGYMAAEFNEIGDYYVIRQNNAHAWCEVYLGEAGWRRYDATPPSLALTWMAGLSRPSPR